MNRLIITSFLLGSFVVLYSCGSDEPKVNEVTEVEEYEGEMPVLDDFGYDTLRGMYVGDFGGSDIRIILNYISSTNVVGYNIHRGLQRNLYGKVERNGDSIIVRMNEPGDHKFDGVFELLFMGVDKEPEGVWKSNSGEISEKEFILEKMDRSAKGYIDDFDVDITTSNLHQFFGEASDTLGEYSFKDDGLVIFSYYPGGYEWEEGPSNQQMTEIQGTWSLKGQRVTIDWEDNKVFPSRMMSYVIRKDDWEAELHREGNSIYMRMYP